MLPGVDLGWPSSTRPLHGENQLEWHCRPVVLVHFVLLATESEQTAAWWGWWGWGIEEPAAQLREWAWRGQGAQARGAVGARRRHDDSPQPGVR